MEKTIVYLFTSPTCPHCPPARKFIHEFRKTRDDFILNELSLADSEGREMANKFGVMSVPTFIIHGPNYPEIIGLRGLQSEKTMSKYLDLSYGIKPEKKKSEGLFSRLKKKFN